MSSPNEGLWQALQACFPLHLSSSLGACGGDSSLDECRRQGAQPTFERGLLPGIPLRTMSSPNPNLVVSSKIKLQLALPPHLPKWYFKVSYDSIYIYISHVWETMTEKWPI